MIKIIVVDDHDLVRAGITRMLADESGFEVVGQACCGEDAISLVREISVDVVLMDIKMPGMGGVEAIRKVLRYDRDIKVICLTAMADDHYSSRAMQAGACGFITKDADVAEMIKAVRLVNSGQRYISPDIAQKMALKAFEPNAEKNVFSELSDREMQIATMLMNCQSVQQISDALCLSPKTVNTYRYRMFDKLSIKSDVELTLLAIKHGLVDAEDIRC